MSQQEELFFLELRLLLDGVGRCLELMVIPVVLFFFYFGVLASRGQSGWNQRRKFVDSGW